MNNSSGLASLGAVGASALATKAAIVGGTASSVASSVGGIGIVSASGITATAVAGSCLMFALPLVAVGAVAYLAIRE